MLPSTIYVQSLVLFGIQYAIKSNAAPADGTIVRVGIPEFHLGLDVDVAAGLDISIKRSAGPEPEPVQLDQPEILPRALSAGQKEALRLHNVARGKKKLKPLVWDEKLWAAAAAYAQKMAKSGVFAHSASNTRPGQGENLAYAWSNAPINMPIVVGTNGWLAEIDNYNNEIIPNGPFEKYGHYTQIMWNTTLRVGLATATNGKGAWYTVGRYSPAGNVYGRRPY